MACIAWTSAQLAIIQACLDAKMSYRQAAEEIRTKHKLRVTHNVIAGLVKRSTLRPSPEQIIGGRGGRVTASAMAQRLTLIKQAFGNGQTSAPIISRETGVNIHRVRRALEKLGLKTNPPYHHHTPRPKGERTPRKRDKTRKKPREHIADPVSSIGVHFLDKRANHCNYIVAKDPKDGLARYCGSHRVMRGKYFASAYCGEHHIACHQIECMEAAE